MESLQKLLKVAEDVYRGSWVLNRPSNAKDMGEGRCGQFERESPNF